MDVGRVLRLKGAIEAALAESVQRGQFTPTSAARALSTLYDRLREEARSVVPPGGPVEEFERLFPEKSGYYAGNQMAEAENYHRARTLLAFLAGWLQGFAIEARLQAEVEAYARERVKAERGVGFRPDPDSPSP